MAGKKTAEFMIVNRRSGKALQATGLDNGLVVEQAEPAKTDAQTWSMRGNPGRRQAFQQGLRQGAGRDGKRHRERHLGADLGRRGRRKPAVEAGDCYPLPIKSWSTSWPDKALDIVDMSDEDGAPAQIWERRGGRGPAVEVCLHRSPRPPPRPCASPPRRRRRPCRGGEARPQGDPPRLRPRG